MQRAVILFGSMMKYYPISATKDKSRVHQFGKNVLPRILPGYTDSIWKEDITVADTEELENWDASEISCSKTQCEGGPHAENGEHFIVSVADGTVKLTGRDHVFRKSHVGTS